MAPSATPGYRCSQAPEKLNGSSGPKFGAGRPVASDRSAGLVDCRDPASTPVAAWRLHLDGNRRVLNQLHPAAKRGARGRKS